MKIDSSVGSRVALGSSSVAGSEQNKIFEHLAYAFKVNEARDAFAGLTLPGSLKMKIAGLSKAMENNQNVANMMNTAQSAFSQVTNILTTIKNTKGLFSGSQTDSKALEAALNNITDAKGNIDSFIANVIEPAINNNSVAMENLRASGSSIADFNFAQDSAGGIGQQLLSNLDISISAHAAQTPHAVLQLLAK